jgi:UDP-2-acetamido-3-amino-2,3-dideoxy-glucuronate N-acetyltransferase
MGLGEAGLSTSETKFVLIGCGYWGRNIARVLGERGWLAAICDPARDPAEGLAQQHGAEYLGSVEAALSRPDCPAVVIATPAATHADLAARALSAGKDVFVEKPLALDLAAARDLAGRAERLGRILMVGHLLQYHPVFERLLALVQAGTVGKLHYLYSNRLNFGRVRREEDVLWSFAPHDISMILAVAGEWPAEVRSSGSAHVTPGLADMARTDLVFASGLLGHVFVSWLHPFKEQKLVVVGKTGMLVFDDMRAPAERLMLYRHKIGWVEGVPSAEKSAGEAIEVAAGEPLLAELEHFRDCVATRTPPRTGAAEAIAVLAVLEAARDSMRSGRPVTPAAEQRFPGVFIHETALVDDHVAIGAGTRIWHFSHILGGVRIGTSCTIGQNVMIGPRTSIGNGCKLQNNVSVYEGVTLEDEVFCGPSAVFTNVLTPRAQIERKAEFAPTLVRRGATIGANATILCGNEIGRWAMIGAGAVVTRDVPEFALMVGNPARRIGWVSRSGERLGPDLCCPRTGERYRETPEGGLEGVDPP